MGSNRNNQFLLKISLILLSSAAFAQEEDASGLDEIIVTGTRTLNRTVADSPVPVDVFKGEDFQAMGTTDMDDMLRTLVPSYNVQRFGIANESAIIRPATLRGLPADNTLILVNSKRRHRGGALVSGATQGPDVSAIPSIAFQRVEVLRDGASAQYGSDAIAGVINYIPRNNDSGFIVEARVGEFFEGDGLSRRISANAGFSLAEDGFLNASLEYGDVESTLRNGQRFDAQALQDLDVEGVPDPAQRWGQQAIDDDWKFFLNGAVPLGSSSELYAFGNYSTRRVTGGFFWRNPNAFSPGVFHDNSGAFGGDRLVFDLTPDGTGNCPLAGSPDAIPTPFAIPTQAELDADAAALDLLRGDPNCWTPLELYPNGFRPDFSGDVDDYAAVLGFRGDRDGGLRYDISASYGTSDVTYRLTGSLNPSMGPDTPTNFRPSATIQTQTSLNADFSWAIETGLFESPLNFAAGLEWREETFEVEAGDEASWLPGPYFPQGAFIGSNGYPGTPPEQAGEWSRPNSAAYVDLEADITEELLLAAALRVEDFEDFGSKVNYKVAFRYRVNDMLGIRASWSSGFRAPTPGQSNSIRTQTRFIGGNISQGGRIPPTDPVAAFFGGKPLEPEESKNLSAGLTFEPLDNLTLTADYFHIDVEDRMGSSPNFELTQDDIDELVARGVPGASVFEFVNFFINGTDTITKGFDVVAAYDVEWGAAGTSAFTLAWNRTDTEVVWQEIPSRTFRLDLEGRPRDRGIFTINHSWNNWGFLLRASYYGEWSDEQAQTLPETAPLDCVAPTVPPTFPRRTKDVCYGDAWILDAEIAYSWNDRYTLVFGADNVLDEYPENAQNALSPFTTGLIYPGASPFGYNGGFAYVRLRADF